MPRRYTRAGMQAAGVAILGLVTLAAAAAAGAPIVHVAGAPEGCPAPRALRAALARLLPAARLVEDESEPSAVTVRIEDGGAMFRIAIGAGWREVRDPARDCAERARVAAVLVVLALAPPAIGGEPAVAAPPAAAPRAPLVTLEAGGVGEAAAPGRGNDAGVTGGGAVRLRVAGRRLGVAFGAAGLAPATVTLARGQARLTRVPVELDLTAAVRARRLELIAGVGLAAAALAVTGQGFAADLGTTRLDLGLHGAVTARWRGGGRVAPFVGLEATLLPRPYDLAVAGLGEVGRTPLLWVRVVAGAALALDGRF